MDKDTKYIINANCVYMKAELSETSFKVLRDSELENKIINTIREHYKQTCMDVIIHMSEELSNDDIVKTLAKYQENVCVRFDNRLYDRSKFQINLLNVQNIFKIIFPSNYNELFILNSNVQEIHLGYYFNKEINNLPSNLKILKFDPDSHFDKQINNLPNGLKILHLSADFSRDLDYLPNSLEELQFGNVKHLLSSNIGLKNLPSGLKILRLSGNFSGNLDYLPNSLEELQIGSMQFLSSFNLGLENLPSSIKKLSIFTSCPQISCIYPNELESLTFMFKISNDFDLENDVFPNNIHIHKLSKLKHLSLSCNYIEYVARESKTLHNLESLNILDTGYSFYYSASNKITKFPQNLKIYFIDCEITENEPNYNELKYHRFRMLFKLMFSNDVVKNHELKLVKNHTLSFDDNNQERIIYEIVKK